MYSSRGGCLGALTKLGLWASRETEALVRGTPVKFFTHLSVDSIVAVDVELCILPSCGLSCFGWPPLLFEWPSLCLWTQSAKFISSSVKDLSMSRFPHSLDEITAFFIYLIIYAIFKFIHTCISLFCANISGAVNGSHSFIHQLFLSFLNNFSSMRCFDTALKLNTCRGDVLA